MNIQRRESAPVNQRGAQDSFLLLTRGQFGSQNLAITWVACTPGSMQKVHAHPDNEQVYVIIRGRGVMHIGDETQELEEGTLVFIPPGSPHAIKNEGQQPLVYISATSPPFDPGELNEYFAYRK